MHPHMNLGNDGTGERLLVGDDTEEVNAILQAWKGQASWS